MGKNVIVGQSGGPTSVINSSLAGVYKTAHDMGATVYGMLNGIQGFMSEEYVDLSTELKTEEDIELLKRTPSAFLGSCRYKLPAIEGNEETFEKIFAIIDKLKIDLFIYIGGNDSMDTINKLAQYALKKGHSTKFMGAPKTIDNDLAVTDHTPGFGSAAKYIATAAKEVLCDARCFKKTVCVNIMEIMGRNAGWLTGAAALSKGEDSVGPDLIYLPELPFDLEDFMRRVKELLKIKSTVFVAVSEGIKTKDGKYVCELASSSDYVDAFGHKQLTGTASALASIVSREIGCKTRAIELSTLQRSAAHIQSKTDVDEAFMSGGAAAAAGLNGETGKMILLKRVSDNPYKCETDLYDVSKISNVEKTVPREWITEDGTNVTEDFINYVMPLIQGEQHPVFENGVPKHLYLK